MSRIKIQHFFHPELAKKITRKDRRGSQQAFNKELMYTNEKRKERTQGPITAPMVITKAILPDGRVGYAMCSPSEPHWNRKLGNKIAIGRAKKETV